MTTALPTISAGRLIIISVLTPMAPGPRAAAPIKRCFLPFRQDATTCVLSPKAALLLGIPFACIAMCRGGRHRVRCFGRDHFLDFLPPHRQADAVSPVEGNR